MDHHSSCYKHNLRQSIQAGAFPVSFTAKITSIGSFLRTPASSTLMTARSIKWSLHDTTGVSSCITQTSPSDSKQFSCHQPAPYTTSTAFTQSGRVISPLCPLH